MDNSQVKSLVDGYQPNAEILAQMHKIKVLATVGPSASGKTTIMRRAAELFPDIHMVVSETAREPRSYETDNSDYTFRTDSEILADLKAGILTNVDIGPNGHLYSTSLSNYSSDKTNVLALIPSSVLNFRKLPFATFSAVFIVPDSFEHWQHWLEKQAHHSGWNEHFVHGRLKEALVSYQFAFSDKQISFVLNDDIDLAAKRLLRVASGQTPDNEDLAKTTAQNNFAQLLKMVNKVD